MTEKAKSVSVSSPPSNAKGKAPKEEVLPRKPVPAQSARVAKPVEVKNVKEPLIDFSTFVSAIMRRIRFNDNYSKTLRTLFSKHIKQKLYGGYKKTYIDWIQFIQKKGYHLDNYLK